MNIIGARVKEARLKSNPKIKQTELAAALQLRGVDVDNTAISKIENGIRPVADIELLRIAEILRVEPHWLLNYKAEHSDDNII